MNEPTADEIVVPAPRDWEACATPGCGGARGAGHDRCLRHLGPAERQAALNAAGGLDLRGVTIDGDLLRGLIASMSGSGGRGKVINGAAQFQHARFEGDIFFRDLSVLGPCSFQNAVFDSDAYFTNVEFEGVALFDQTEIAGSLSLQSVSARRDLLFSNGSALNLAAVACQCAALLQIFRQKASIVSIKEATIDRLVMQQAEFENGVLSESSFNSIRLQGSQVKGFLLSGCSVRALHIQEISARELLGIDRCHVSSVSSFETTGTGTLRTSNSTFVDRFTLVASVARADLTQARFPDGVTLRIDGAEIALDQADFGRPSVLTSTLMPPQLLSARTADLENLSIDRVELNECRFAGAHNLDRLRFESASLFALAPRQWRAAWPARYTRRRILEEERDWRARNGHEDPRWPRREMRDWLKPSPQLRPRDLAALYRSLRKAREDAKDEPGAADFYYGEMEMRRLDPSAPWTERAILTAYWFLAGYGLRASRALTLLLVLTFVFAVAFWQVGLAATVHSPHPSFWRALTFAAGAATLHPPARALTTAGDALAIAFRVIGPVLLALALLSIRGRVRR